MAEIVGKAEINAKKINILPVFANGYLLKKYIRAKKRTATVITSERQDLYPENASFFQNQQV
jgi:hypothetical protein